MQKGIRLEPGSKFAHQNQTPWGEQKIKGFVGSTFSTNAGSHYQGRKGGEGAPPERHRPAAQLR